MENQTVNTKQDEQHPLLKVHAGFGDVSGNTPPLPSIGTAGGNVSRPSKPAWKDRWPELVSACWMSLILLGLAFIGFCALSTYTYRRPSMLIIRNNSSCAHNNVYYHRVIETNYVPLNLYSDYITEMAIEYPLLRHHVIFLVDDTLQSSLHATKHSRFMNRLMSSHTNAKSYFNINENNKKGIEDFSERYPNVNITVTSLTKFMAGTPFKFNLRSIPLAYLPFYARIFDVWRNGGIGLELIRFNRCRRISRKIAAILKLHNDGKVGDYSNELKRVDFEEDMNMFPMFSGLLNQVMWDTGVVFNKTRFNAAPTKNLETKKFYTRTNRNKREISSSSTKSSYNNSDDDNVINLQLTDAIDFENKTTEMDANHFTDYVNMTTHHKYNITSMTVDEKNDSRITAVSSGNNSGKEHAQIKPMVIVFDFSILSDPVGPAYQLSEHGSLETQEVKTAISSSVDNIKYFSNQIAIDPDGQFVAAPYPNHPFLRELIAMGCQRMHPTFAIKDVLIAQCSLFHRDAYCKNICLL